MSEADQHLAGRAVNVLSSYPLFGLLGRPALAAWAAAGEAVPLRDGQPLFCAGETGQHLYVLLRGRARVSRAARGEPERDVAEDGPGAVLGDYALLPPFLNTATCRASGPGLALRLPLPPVRAALRRVPDVGQRLKAWLRLNALVALLRGGAGLGFLSAPSLLPLLDRCQPLTFGPAHTVQADGLLSDRWLYVESGEVALHAPGEAPRVLGVGDCFGERALLGRGRLAVAVALAPTRCWALSREQFHLPLDAEAPSSMQTHLTGLPRRWGLVAQKRPADCGVAALAMALRGAGLEVGYDRLAALVSPGAGGASLAALARAAEQTGARATPVRIGAEQLPHARLPAVAHQAGGHYVTLFEVWRDEVVVGDPADGMASETVADFRRTWSGHLLLIAPAEA